MRDSQLFIAKQIIKTVGETLGVDICEKSRKKEIVYMRFVCFRLLKDKYPKITFMQLASIFKRDHATIIHGISMYEKLKRYPDFKEIEAKIVAAMGSFSKEEIEFCETTTYPSYV